MQNYPRFTIPAGRFDGLLPKYGQEIWRSNACNRPQMGGRINSQAPSENCQLSWCQQPLLDSPNLHQMVEANFYETCRTY